MRMSLLLIVILLISLSTSAQDKSFDLSKYKIPDYKRHELTTSFGLSGGSNSYTEKSYSGSELLESADFKNSDFSSTLSLNYQYNFNSRKKVTYASAILNSELDYDKAETPDNTTKTTETSFDFSFWGYENHYLTEDKFFVRLAPSFYFHPQREKEKLNSNTEKYKYTAYNIDIGVGAGYGRIEPVSDLWQSYYILKSLEKDGLLEKKLTEADILEFASLSTKLKNKRFFDFRLRKIAELETLDSLIHAKGLIMENSISYFTTLNDYWSFANISDRYSGRQITAMLTPSYQGSSSQLNDDEKSKSHTTILTPSIEYNCYKPINLYWDRIFMLRFHDDILLDEEPENNRPSSYFNVYSSLSFRYLPNFRTLASISLIYYGQEHTKYRYPEEDYKKYWNNQVYLNGSLSYYISPQLRFNALFSIRYQDENYYGNDFTRDDNIYLYYNLGLSYAIF